jgi:hypothetical protein
MDLKTWLEERRDLIARRWYAEIRVREGPGGEEPDGLVATFLAYLVAFLPTCLVDHREPGEIVWEQAAHLYGSVALRRGLAAGEVVEELQHLRGVILRLLLENLESGAGWVPRAREVLMLNQILDLGVVRASISYVDDLFFTHLQGSGVPQGVDGGLVKEIERELETFRQELNLDPLPRTENP